MNKNCKFPLEYFKGINALTRRHGGNHLRCLRAVKHPGNQTNTTMFLIFFTLHTTVNYSESQYFTRAGCLKTMTNLYGSCVRLKTNLRSSVVGMVKVGFFKGWILVKFCSKVWAA